ncbi:unnamed protein product [Cunninghamella blakesleeana]
MMLLTRWSSSYFVLIFISLLFNHIHKTNGQSNKVTGRLYPGCALSGDKLFCYGGFSGLPENNNALTYTNTYTDHLELDLTLFGNLTTFNSSKIQWNGRSNIINGSPIIGAADIATATLSDGSYIMYGGRSNHLIDFPFARYNPQSDTWNRNDKIWMFGGDVRAQGQTPLLRLSIYDFKIGSWSTLQPYVGNPPADNTVTLVGSTIYLLGGANIQFGENGGFRLTPFNYIQTFNTIDSSWGNITTNGDRPTDRCFHSTTLTNDNKYLLVYGGIIPNSQRFAKSEDAYYVYDIQNNVFKYVSLGPPPQSNTAVRFGHFAAIYKSKFMLLAFGYNDLTTAADNLNVLNIQDPFSPSWVAYPTDTPTNNNNNNIQTSASNDVNIKTVVPAVVVPVTVALLGIAVGVFLCIRRRKKKQQNAFVLEQQDPRKALDNQDYSHLVALEDGTNTVKGSDPSHPATSGLETSNPLTINQHQSNNNNSNTVIYGKADLPNSDIQNNHFTKPFETNPTIKPFEA